MINRRRIMQSAAMLAALPLAARAEDLSGGMESSDLIYISPLKSDGSESRCQAEIWFQLHDDALFVVTAAEAWRARAPKIGLNRARVWVGDVGNWKNSNGAYLELPQLEMRVEHVTDASLQGAVLEKMGDKYSGAWLLWGPRFRSGLKDGSRVMLRYV